MNTSDQADACGDVMREVQPLATPGRLCHSVQTARAVKVTLFALSPAIRR